MSSRAHLPALLAGLLALAATAAPARAEESPPPASAATAPALAAATPHSFTATATPDRVKLGERFTYRIEIRDAADLKYALPKDLKLGDDFELIKVESHRDVKDGEAVTRFDITAAAFSLEEKRLPDLTLEATGPGGPRALVVPGPAVTGEGALGADPKAEMKDALPPVDVLVRDYLLLWVAAAAFVATAALILLWRAWKRRPRKAHEVVAPPPLPLEARARAALEALRAQGLPALGRTREFYFRLSEILRGYLGERFGFDALDMTTSELLAALERRPTPGLDQPAFTAFCHEADLVKFARAPADAAACDAALASALAFVDATTPAAAPAPAPGATAAGAASGDKPTSEVAG